MASFVASFKVLLPDSAGIILAPNIFILATLGACLFISTEPIYITHSIPANAQTVAVATPC